MTQQALFENVDLEPIRQALRKRLADGERALIWQDEEGSFAQAVLDLDIDGLDVYRVEDGSQLELKLRLAGVPRRPFLLYRSGPAPAYQEDLFLDVVNYAGKFRADSSSLRLNELGLGHRPELSSWYERRKKFLASGPRVAKFRALLGRQDSEEDLDRKAVAVLCKVPIDEPREILLSLFDGVAEVGLNGQPPVWDDILKFGLADTVWAMAEERFGLPADVRAFRPLLLRLFATDVLRCLPRESALNSLQHLLLPKAGEVSVFLSQWRDSLQRSPSYNRLALEATLELDIVQAISGLGADDLSACETFEAIDRRIIAAMRDELKKSVATVRRAELAELARRRLAGYWTHHQTRGGDALAACYEALVSAVDLLGGVEAFRREVIDAPSSALPFAYLERWSGIDRAYRKFNYWAQVAEAQSLDLLDPLGTKIENIYANDFLQPLGTRWSEMLESGSLEKWAFPGVAHQRRFFNDFIKAPLESGTVRRIFVIISDALRYEAGVELAERLRQFRLVPEVKAMTSVLPSITKLGMAALLPHKALAWPTATVVTADGLSTAGLENRNSILAKAGGIAMTSDQLKSLKREDGRARVRDAQVIYIYHNVIDARGDHSATEGQTFAAVEEALEDLGALARRVIDHLNGSIVLITADHGFLYSESKLTEVDRSELGAKPDHALDAKKRYLVGRDLGSDPRFHVASLAKTAGIDGLEAWYPKSAQRFHLAGGAQYVHGGPMPQEIFVPVVVVREAEGDSSTKTRPVSIVLATAPSRVTTNTQSWKFLQTEKVGERLKPLRATFAIYDGQRPVSNVETVLFDSTADTIADRERFVRLSLASEKFDSGKTYTLIVRNSDDGLEVLRHPLKLEIAFLNEF